MTSETKRPIQVTVTIEQCIERARGLISQLEDVAQDEKNERLTPEVRANLITDGMTMAAWSVYHLNDEVRAAAFARGCTK